MQHSTDIEPSGPAGVLTEQHIWDLKKKLQAFLIQEGWIATDPGTEESFLFLRLPDHEGELQLDLEFSEED